MNRIYEKLTSSKAIKWYKILVFVALLVFFAFLVTNKIPLPAAEDLPRQMANGRDILHGNFDNLTKNVYSYSEPDHFFANHHWLYGVFAYILHGVVGWSGMVVFKVLLILLTFSLLFRTALRKADFWFVALCSIPFMLMMAYRSDLRPELFGYFFIVLYLYFLFQSEENPKSNLIYWLIPIQLLWANLHITFPIGVAIVAGFLLEKIILNYKNLKGNLYIKKLAIVLCTLIAVSFINPNGINGVIYSLGINSSAGPVVSAEVQKLLVPNNDAPINDAFPFSFFIPMLYIAGASLILAYRKKPIFYFLALTSTAALTFLIMRSFPFFAIFFVLAVPDGLNNIWIKVKAYLKERLRDTNEIGTTILFTVLLLGGIVSIAGYKYTHPPIGYEYGIGLSHMADSSAQFFIDNNLHGPIMNDTDIGSYLVWYLYPKERVFADNRFGDAYSKEFFGNDYKPLFTDENKWKEMLGKYNFNTIFLYQYDAGSVRDFIFRRVHDPEWSFVYADKYAVILVRNVPENQPVIQKFAITRDNVQTRLGDLMNSFKPNDLVAVGDLFGLMGEVPLSRAAFTAALSQNPFWGKIWYVMGRMELNRSDSTNSDPALALLFLKQAINNGWETPYAYSYLALAYYRLGQTAKAEEAVQKELKLNPESNDAKIWLGTFAKDKIDKLNSQNQ